MPRIEGRWPELNRRLRICRVTRQSHHEQGFETRGQELPGSGADVGIMGLGKYVCRPPSHSASAGAATDSCDMIVQKRPNTSPTDSMHRNATNTPLSFQGSGSSSRDI